MSALVGKLISLNLHEQAIKELRILKKKLEASSAAEPKKTAKTTNPEPKNAAQVFSELLDFGAITASGQRLLLVITTQIQILRVLTMTKKPSAIEAALPYLRVDHVSSPVSLLLVAAREDGADVGKIARQMETAAQCLLSLAPSVSSKDDSLAQESRLSISPASALELQALAFEARLHWWKLAKHKGDAEKDIMVPLSRCLSAYIRRTSESSKSSYVVCSEIFNRIHQQLQSHSFHPSKGSKLPFAGICQTLVTLARDAQQIPDAIMWATKLRAATDPEAESVAKSCSLAAQLLSLHLKFPTKYLSDDQLLNEVVARIQGPLRGDTAELDELLTNVCAVRKAAMHLLLTLAKGGDNVSQPLPSIKELLETFILQCPRFCLRWLGKPPGPTGSTKDYLRYEQRRQLVLQYLQHILDSAFMTIKTCLDQSRLPWNLMDSILSDCNTLLEYTGHKSTSDASASYHVKISHFYYLQYSRLRQQSTDPKDPAPLRALRRSVECVKDRTSAEKEKAQLTLKLERMAELCRALGRGEEALGALQAIRTSLLEDGVLLSIAKAIDTESPAVVWTRNEKAEALSRTLLAISKMEQVWMDWTVDLEEAERAAALEHRLRFILLREGSKATDVTLEHPVVDTLLRIYIPTRYPVRRLRVLLTLLCTALGDLGRAPELLSVAKDAAQLDEKGDLGEDSGLVGFVPHMKALYYSLAAAVDAYRDSNALDQSIRTWRSILTTCRDRATLDKSVDDVPGLLEHLQSVADFVRMKGRDTMLASVLELITDIARVADGPNAEEAVRHSSSLALQYTNLGQSSKAEEVFLKAKEYIGDQGRGEALVHFHLTFTDHFLTIGNFRQAEDHLSQAELAFNTASAPDKHARAERRRLVAYAYYLNSMIALERGDSHHALAYSRDSVRILFQDWTKLETQIAPKTSPDQSQLDGQTLNLSTVDLSPQSPGPEFWRIFHHLYRNVLRLSSLYAHLGMFQETMYYAEQALKMAKAVDSDFYNAECAAWIGSVCWKAANIEKSHEMLEQASALLPDDNRSYSSATLACQMGSIHVSQNNLEGAQLLLAKAQAIAQDLAVIPAVVDQATETAQIENKMEKLSIAPKPARGGRKAAVTKAPARKTTKGTAKSKPPTQAAPTPVASAEDAQLAKLRATILVRKAESMLRQKEWSAAQAILVEATAAKASGLLPARHVAMALCLMGRSLEQMAQDPVFSVIQDSTISFPALTGADKASPAQLKASSPKKSRSPASEGQARLYVNNLREAHDYLLEAQSMAALSGDASLVHRISVMLQNVGLFLTAASTKSKAAIHSAQTAYAVELARNLTWRRERKALIQEKNSTKNDKLDWPPALHSAATRRSSLGFTLDLHKIQRDYIDIAPKSWNIISISLSEGNHDLCITKFQAGQTPFVIRLPLERASSRDADSDVFDFQQGRTELLEIVKLINQTSHDSRNMTVKGAKSEWWAEREALDERLKELLGNIEHIWLGGFRGIFSQHVRRPELLARFQKDFLAVLDKHLPSRRQVRGKKGKAAQVPKATLDLNVLELFIGLGDATQPNSDFDDELTDLLYFVVDILQFHGEWNAYDEIDFDSMVVETMDALTAYHSAANAADDTLPAIHTILLLDKALHIFPWESLPCMQGLPVSRVPSLACLRRLLLDRHQPELTPSSSCPPAEGHHTPPTGGTYILNPSSDLTSTQSLFSPSFSTLPQWKGISARPPTEEEFASALSDSNILLYFGHGSGAQYIRGRTIRRLDKCRATVLLMGCSSAALSDNGEFEPAGPVWNYMMAGCPAVVGTLWDVTDRDLDRFAAGVVEKWGVVERGVLKGDDGSRGRGKGKGGIGKGEKGCGGAEGESGSGKGGGYGNASLVEAVARSRGKCKLRYVTAAAVVVYGIPVYVER
jgi:separase